MDEAASKSRDELLEMPISELVECWIGVRCLDRCNRSAYLPLKLMAAKRGRRLPLSDVVARLRCEVCKTSPAEVWLVDHPIEDGRYGGVAASWRVGLVP